MCPRPPPSAGFDTPRRRRARASRSRFRKSKPWCASSPLAAELERLQAAIDALDGRLQTAGEDEDEAYRAAAADVLARWPVLDDPWHPEFSATLERARPAIESHLETSETYAAYLAARTRVDSLGAKVWDLRRRAAPYERLARAHETIELAGRLRAAGGPAFTTYEQILACERTPIDVPGT
jgi:hypothetical protein